MPIESLLGEKISWNSVFLVKPEYRGYNYVIRIIEVGYRLVFKKSRMRCAG